MIVEEEPEPPAAAPPAGAPPEVKAEVDEKEKDATRAPEKPAVPLEPVVMQKKIEDRSADRGPAPADMPLRFWRPTSDWKSP